jgi:hypothetical protein
VTSGSGLIWGCSNWKKPTNGVMGGISVAVCFFPATVIVADW